MKKIITTLFFLAICSTSIKPNNFKSDEIIDLLTVGQKEMMQNYFSGNETQQQMVLNILDKTIEEQKSFYAKNLSDKEALQIIDFLKSDIGKKFIELQISFTEETLKRQQEKTAEALSILQA